ncbi:MAG: hypothetical protein PHW60_02940 [Kiritimatiellae bacterium]|nr:hypothetical protein [Kiritimatiellia bacterium]
MVDKADRRIVLYVYCANHESSQFRIQWMRYGEKYILPNIIREVAHVAFEVEALNRALQGKEVIINPNSPSEGVTVAFIFKNGAPVKLLEFTDINGMHNF